MTRSIYSNSAHNKKKLDQVLLNRIRIKTSLFSANVYLDKCKSIDDEAMLEAKKCLKQSQQYTEKFFLNEKRFTISPSITSSCFLDPLKPINVHPTYIRVIITTARVLKAEKEYHPAMTELNKAQCMINDFDKLPIDVKTKICRPEIMQLQEEIFIYIAEIYLYWFDQNKNVRYIEKSIEQFSYALALSARLKKMLHCCPFYLKSFEKKYATSVAIFTELYPNVAANTPKFYFHVKKAINILRTYKLTDQIKKIEQFEKTKGFVLSPLTRNLNPFFTPIGNV